MLTPTPVVETLRPNQQPLRTFLPEENGPEALLPVSVPMNFGRNAEIYAEMAREAMKRRSPSLLSWSQKFNDAILNCLKHNVAHPKARKLLVEMGGKIR